MKIIVATIVIAIFASAVAEAAVPARPPVWEGFEVKNCGANKSQPSSVRITTEYFNGGLETVRYAFQNIVTGQVHNFDRHANSGPVYNFNLPGGSYTLKVGRISENNGATYPGSIQFLYESPIGVPLFINGKCIPPAAATTMTKSKN